MTWTKEEHEAAKAGKSLDALDISEMLDEIERGWAEIERLHDAVCHAQSDEIDKLNVRLAHAHDAANKLYQAAQAVVIAWDDDAMPDNIRDLRAALDPTEAEACAKETTRRDGLEAEIRRLTGELVAEPMQPSATRAQRLAAMARALTMSDTNVEENLRSAINLMDNVCDALGCAPEKAAEKAREIAERLARTQAMCTSLTRSVEELSAALIAARQSGAISTSPKMTELEARIMAIENRLGRKHIEASDLDRFSHRRHLAWSDPVQAIMTEGARPSWQTRDLVWPDGERHPYERTRGPEIEGAMDALTTPRATLHAGDTGNAPAPDEDADWTVRFRERFGATLEFSDQRQPRRPYVKATITRGDVNDANVEIKKHVSGITEVTVLRPEDT